MPEKISEIQRNTEILYEHINSTRITNYLGGFIAFVVLFTALIIAIGHSGIAPVVTTTVPLSTLVNGNVITLSNATMLLGYAKNLSQQGTYTISSNVEVTVVQPSSTASIRTSNMVILIVIWGLFVSFIGIYMIMEYGRGKDELKHQLGIKG